MKQSRMQLEGALTEKLDLLGDETYHRFYSGYVGAEQRVTSAAIDVPASVAVMMETIPFTAACLPM